MQILLPLRRLGAVGSLATLAAASDLHVGPPGSQFSTIDAAIAAAAPGDRIYVAPGTYKGFQLSKPVEIRGAGVGLTFIGTSDSSALTSVSGIPLGATATLADMSFKTGWFLTVEVGAQISIVDNPGTVVLQNVRTNPAPIIAWHYGAGVDANHTARLVIQGCSLKGISDVGFPSFGAPGLAALNSSLDVTDTVLTATSSAEDFLSGAAGAYLQNCVARFARVQSNGGSGGVPGGAGVELVGSTLVIAGGPANKLQGAASSTSGAGLSLRVGSVATLASDVLLVGGNNGSGAVPGLAVDATSVATTLAHKLPALVPLPQEVALGSPYTLQHTGRNNAVVVPAISSGLGPALAFGGLDGLLHLDLAQLVLLPKVVLGGTGAGTSSGSVPAQPSLAGAHAWFQAAELDVGTARFSNPARIEISL
jgi:hypothetical protein